jgi:hypothetical protein
MPLEPGTIWSALTPPPHGLEALAGALLLAAAVLIRNLRRGRKPELHRVSLRLDDRGRDRD